MDLEHGIEALDNLEGMRIHCEGVLSDLAGGGFISRIRSAVVERELADVRNRIGKLRVDLAEACDREIEASGVPSVSLADTMALARRLGGMSTKAAAVASACRNWRESETESLIKDFAREVDGLKLETRIKLIDGIDDADPAERETDVVRMSTFLRNYVGSHGAKATAAKLDALSGALGAMRQEQLDFAWKIRGQMVALEMADPSPGLVQVVGRITGRQVSWKKAPSM